MARSKRLLRRSESVKSILPKSVILVCVYELMRAKRQANISVPPTLPGGRGVTGAAPFKTPRCGKLKSVREGFSTE